MLLKKTAAKADAEEPEKEKPKVVAGKKPLLVRKAPPKDEAAGKKPPAKSPKPKPKKTAPKKTEEPEAGDDE